MLRKGIHRIVSVTMLLFLSNKLSRTVGPNSRLWVQAFSTTNGAFSYPKTKTSPTINNNNGLTLLLLLSLRMIIDQKETVNAIRQLRIYLIRLEL